MATIRVLFDGWPLVYHPSHPQSIHLRTLLALTPEGTESVLALPSENHQLGEGLNEKFEWLTMQENDAGRWQQRILAKLAEQHNAQIIHSTSQSASLFGRVSTVVSPAENNNRGKDGGGLRGRLGQSLGRGGLARAHILWPSDLPQGQLPGNLHTLSPVVHSAFKAANADTPASFELPETYILHHSPGDSESLLKLLESWTWAASSIGEYFPLLMLGLDEKWSKFVKARLPEYHLEDYVQVLPTLGFKDLIAVYQHCSALAHPSASSLWGGPIRHALASGKAVVAFKDAQTEAMVGPAAYLVPQDDLRSFGAALISAVVDEKVTDKLEEAARQRAATWEENKFKEELLSIYRELN